MNFIETKLHCERKLFQFIIKMPLSSALQQRLIERGILNASNINAALGKIFNHQKFLIRLFFSCCQMPVQKMMKIMKKSLLKIMMNETIISRHYLLLQKRYINYLLILSFFYLQFFRVISQLRIFKLNWMIVLNARTNGIHTILV